MRSHGIDGVLCHDFKARGHLQSCLCAAVVVRKLGVGSRDKDSETCLPHEFKEPSLAIKICSGMGPEEKDSGTPWTQKACPQKNKSVFEHLMGRQVGILWHTHERPLQKATDGMTSRIRERRTPTTSTYNPKQQALRCLANIACITTLENKSYHGSMRSGSQCKHQRVPHGNMFGC